jgi:hypothetical protein
VATGNYTVREAAERLGVPVAVLAQRLREGAFPGRFLSLGPDGPEQLIPADDVQRAVAAQRMRGREAWVEAAELESGIPTARATLLPRRAPGPLDPLVEDEVEFVSTPGSDPVAPEASLVAQAVRGLLERERGELVAALERVVSGRDREVEALRVEVARLREELGVALAVLEEHAGVAAERALWAEALAGMGPVREVERVLSEVEAIEGLLASRPAG